jgi:predicted enzyme related to lactoylglutathione lyase
MAKFYAQAFGWKAQMLGKEMNDYVLVTTTEGDGKGRPKKPGAINGGFFKKSNDVPSPHPSVVIGVDDIHASMKKVTTREGRFSASRWRYPVTAYAFPSSTRKETA